MLIWVPSGASLSKADDCFHGGSERRPVLSASSSPSSEAAFATLDVPERDLNREHQPLGC